jgi:two-component system, response regulator PdtaR
MNRPVVLIVEDDFLIRMHATELVEAAGFLSLQASNADEAVEILEKRTDIAVLFTDIQMPGSMDGLKLAAAVHRRWPPIKILATSGQLRVDRNDLPTGGLFLAKPYSASEVGNQLRGLTGFNLETATSL